MVNRDILINKCKEMRIIVTGKERISVLNKKLLALGVTLTDSQQMDSRQQEQPQFQLSTEQLEKIVESVVCKLNKTTPGDETPKNNKQVVYSSSSSDEEELAESEGSTDENNVNGEVYEQAIQKKRKRKQVKEKTNRKKKTGKSISVATAYTISESVKNNIFQGKLVSLHKLLPGSNSHSQGLSSFSGNGDTIHIKLGDNNDKKLSRQQLDYPQMMLALIKLKDIVGTVSNQRELELDSYIKNITWVKTKYGGSAYWSYHLYYWDKAAEYLDRGVPLDWSVLNAEALHAAIAQNKKKTGQG